MEEEIKFEEKLMIYLRQSGLEDEINQNLLAYKTIGRDIKGNLYTQFKIYLYGTLIDVRIRKHKLFDGQDNSIVKFSVRDWFDDADFKHREDFKGLCEVIMKRFNIKFSECIDYNSNSLSGLKDQLNLVLKRISVLEQEKSILMYKIGMAEKEKGIQKVKK